MELLVWHDALGCDDEQASEPELLARVLYAYSAAVDGADTTTSSGGDRARLQTLHFVQGLLAFVRMLKRSESDERSAATASTDSTVPHERLEWVNVTLSRRRFFIQEVEPQIFVALVRLTPVRSLSYLRYRLLTMTPVAMTDFARASHKKQSSYVLSLIAYASPFVG